MKLAAFLLTSLLTISSGVQACTLFAANGNAVAGNGTIIAKNRDFSPAPQEISYKAKGGSAKYDVFALYGINPSTNGSIFVGGVNEKGLVMVVAMADSIPQKQYNEMPRKITIDKILANCSTVDEAVKSEYLGPRFYLVADRNEIAYVEVGEGGKTAVKRVKNGTLAHSNHYLEPVFNNLNIKVGPSSLARYERATELLTSSNNPFTMEDFITMCNDRHDGPDNSLWRVGSKPNSPQTLASFVVDLNKTGDFNVYLKFRPRPEDKGNETVLRLAKKDIFKN